VDIAESNCFDHMTSNHLLSHPQGDKKPARKKALEKKKQIVPPHLLSPPQGDKKPAASKNKRQKRAKGEVEQSTPEDKGRGTASATGTVAGSPAAKKKSNDISEDDSAGKEVSRYLATWCRFRDNVHFDESTPFSDGRQKKAWISRNPIVWIT
jgi:hypothetical protein